MDNTPTRRTDPGSGYLKSVVQLDEKSADFRGHAYVPEQFKLLEELQAKLGVEVGIAAYRMILGRKLSIYGWLKEKPDQPLGIALTAREWKEDL